MKSYPYYDIDLIRQGHPIIFYLIAHYFSKHLVKELIKSGHNPRDIPYFHFFPCNQFSTWKRKTKLCGNPYRCAYYLYSLNIPIKTCKTLLKIISRPNLFDPQHFLFSTLPGKGGKRSKIFGNMDDDHWLG